MTAGAPFCRDCLSVLPGTARRCPHCGSPRLLVHPERDRLGIAHIDCDAFYASVEKRDDPALRDSLVAHGLETIRARHTCAHRARELMSIAATLGITEGASAA